MTAMMMMVMQSLLLAAILGGATTEAFALNGGGSSSFSRGLARRSVGSPQRQQQQQRGPTMLFGGLAAAAAAHTIASAPMDVTSLRQQLSAPASAPVLLAKTETREGVYGTYEVEVKDQAFDDAASKFKSKGETAKGKNKYNTVLLVLLVGSFVIPMVQYYWYIYDEDKDYE